VLRIERSQEGRTVTLAISGTLAGEYLAEVEKAIAAERGKRLALDLENVTDVCREGVAMLAGLEARGVRLSRCPEYLREWVSRERG
jgi:hypothetical protein